MDYPAASMSTGPANHSTATVAAEPLSFVMSSADPAASSDKSTSTDDSASTRSSASISSTAKSSSDKTLPSKSSTSIELSTSYDWGFSDEDSTAVDVLHGVPTSSHAGTEEKEEPEPKTYAPGPKVWAKPTLDKIPQETKNAIVRFALYDEHIYVMPVLGQPMRPARGLVDRLGGYFIEAVSECRKPQPGAWWHLTSRWSISYLPILGFEESQVHRVQIDIEGSWFESSWNDLHEGVHGELCRMAHGIQRLPHCHTVHILYTQQKVPGKEPDVQVHEPYIRRMFSKFQLARMIMELGTASDGKIVKKYEFSKKIGAAGAS